MRWLYQQAAASMTPEFPSTTAAGLINLAERQLFQAENEQQKTHFFKFRTPFENTIRIWRSCVNDTKHRCKHRLNSPGLCGSVFTCSSWLGALCPAWPSAMTRNMYRVAGFRFSISAVYCGGSAITISCQVLSCSMYSTMYLVTSLASEPRGCHFRFTERLVIRAAVNDFGASGGSSTCSCTSCWSRPYKLLAWQKYGPLSVLSTLTICASAAIPSWVTSCLTVTLRAPNEQECTSME